MFQKKTDTLDSLDLGLNYINKIKKVVFILSSFAIGERVINTDVSNLAISDEEILQNTEIETIPKLFEQYKCNIKVYFVDKNETAIKYSHYRYPKKFIKF